MLKIFRIAKMDEEEDEKVFVLAGYTTAEQQAEKLEIIDM